MSKPFIYILLLFLAVSQVVNAQYNKYQGRRVMPKIFEGMHVYAKVGPNIWVGDLVDKGRYRVGLSLGAEREIFNWMSAQLEFDGGFLHGYMTGDGADMDFKTFFVDVNAGVKISILDLIQGYYADRVIVPYGAIGGGFMFFNAKKHSHMIYDKSNPLNNWQDMEPGWDTAPFIWGTVGCKYRITPVWTVFGEIRPVAFLSDEIDAHTGFRENGVWKESKSNDYMYNMMFGVSYRISHQMFYTTNKYNRRNYVKNKKLFKRNAQSLPRRR